MKTNLEIYNELKKIPDVVKTLKEISFDNKRSVYLVSTLKNSIDFDAVKDHYYTSGNKPKSCDALKLNFNKLEFIEFKNILSLKTLKQKIIWRKIRDKFKDSLNLLETFIEKDVINRDKSISFDFVIPDLNYNQKNLINFKNMLIKVGVDNFDFKGRLIPNSKFDRENT